MQCTNPVTISTKNLKRKQALVNNFGTSQIEVPCGKCLACHIRYANEWGLRMMHELESWDTGSYITLSYSDNNQPEHMSISKIELQTFFKRLRTFSYPWRIKYFACGDYGDRQSKEYYLINYGRPFGRPHYHAIVFGLSREDMKIALPRVWDKCDWTPIRLRKSIDVINFNTARYVAQYIDTKYYGEKQRQLYDLNQVEPPFRLSSQRLGLDFALKNKQQFSKNLFTSIHGKKISLPRYYIRQLGISKFRLQLLGDFRKLEDLRELESKGIYDLQSIQAIQAQHREGSAANLEGKAELRRLRKKSFLP